MKKTLRSLKLACLAAVSMYKNDPLGSANNKINDAYLKHNGQTAGVNSYNDVAELLIAFEMRK